jgi:hypothetical protein
MRWQHALVRCAAATVAVIVLANAGDGADEKPVTVVQIIDRQIDAHLKDNKISASGLADDAEFLRRAYLDITGVIPPADKAAAFIDTTDPAKRSKLIDELLASHNYGRHMADIWQDLLVPHDSNNRRLPPDALHAWLEKAFNDNQPWDKLVFNIMTASGSQEDNAAVTYFIANPTPDKVTDSATRLFLGVQLQCAQCHNHPFTSWKQTEYWGMAAFFMKVRPDNAKKANKKGANLSVVETPVKGGGKRKLPESAKIVPAKFLQGNEPKLDNSEPYRPVVARWMTSPENPFFARAMVNRVWGQFFGRGLVNPIDDMHDGNPASHPELLKHLAANFTQNKFDLKQLIRDICNSQAYQRTSKPTASNKDDATLFSHMSIKPLSPEQLYDSLSDVVGGPAAIKEERGKKAQGKRQPGGPRTQFINFFRVDDNTDATEYTAGIPQALRLMNSAQFARGGTLLNGDKNATPEQLIDRLYLGTIARRPTTTERQKLLAHVEKHKGDERKAYGDILWALVNSSEFALNH